MDAGNTRSGEVRNYRTCLDELRCWLKVDCKAEAFVSYGTSEAEVDSVGSST